MSIIEQQGTILLDTNICNPDAFSDQPWADLTTLEDVEAWIEQHNRDLLRGINKTNAAGCGVCFSFKHGGQIFLHTTEGAILLDVTPEAEWVVPVITAATGIEAPQTQIWVLPDNILTQLVLGLSSLVASTRIVASHNYKTRK